MKRNPTPSFRIKLQWVLAPLKYGAMNQTNGQRTKQALTKEFFTSLRVLTKCNRTAVAIKLESGAFSVTSFTVKLTY